MADLRSFAPSHLTEAAKHSGFFQCQKCGLVWFGKPDAKTCPECPDGRPVHVAIICRACDGLVALEDIAEHLARERHTRPS